MGCLGYLKACDNCSMKSKNTRSKPQNTNSKSHQSKHRFFEWRFKINGLITYYDSLLEEVIDSLNWSARLLQAFCLLIIHFSRTPVSKLLLRCVASGTSSKLAARKRKKSKYWSRSMVWEWPCGKIVKRKTFNSFYAMNETLYELYWMSNIFISARFYFF